MIIKPTCISPKHKILTDRGWVDVTELTGDEYYQVQADFENGLVSVYEDKLSPVTQKEMYHELKETNSDGRTQCVACGTIIVEPYPRIRYCPKCER